MSQSNRYGRFYQNTERKHYGLEKIMARIKSTEILLIFFGIHTANAVLFSQRLKMVEAGVEEAAAE